MSVIATIISILISLSVVHTHAQSQASCYYYGCTSIEVPTQDCQCNRACKFHGNCCDDQLELCEPGHFEECPNAPDTPEDRRENKNTLKLISWNVKWLFLDYSHSMGGFYCPGDACDWENTPDAYAHMQAIAEYLDTFNADIILLQEVADCWTIQQLIDAMVNNGPSYKPYLLRGTDTLLGQNVALVTKIDPLDDLYRNDEFVPYPVTGGSCETSDNEGIEDSNKHFRSRFRIDGLNQDLSIFNFHLLYIPPLPANCRRREAEATVIASMIREDSLNGNLIIAAGDYNDFASSVCDIICNVPISSVETIIRTATPNEPMINAANWITDVNERYSAWWPCFRNCSLDPACLEIIDHVIMSPQLYDMISDFTIDHGFVTGCDTLYSDHFPNVVTFNIDTKPPQPHCRIGETCDRTEDCCSDDKERDRAVTCSGYTKWDSKMGHNKYCCVNNMGHCHDDVECCGGKTKCIDYKCHNSGQWRALSAALAAWGIIDENDEFINSDGNIELNIPLKYMLIGMCLIILCVVLPCYQCWKLIYSRTEHS